ncbi:MAG: phosphoribosylformylglycinamidine synthase subunit PurS [Calditrichaeota bacterium]|nr:phosphoribosylformylglycinamidine synthase subunit PurS [Calditrichota bacterium]
MKFVIKVRLKKGILDPQGKTVNQALHHLGYEQIRDVRIGKLIEVEIDESDPRKARQILEEASQKLLANPVIEDFEIQPEE